MHLFLSMLVVEIFGLALCYALGMQNMIEHDLEDIDMIEHAIPSLLWLVWPIVFKLRLFRILRPPWATFVWS